MARKRLGELLIELGIIDEMQLQAALGEQRRYGHSLGRVLVEKGWVQEPVLVQVLAQQLNVPIVELRGRSLPAEALSKLEPSFCLEHSCIPFAYTDRGKFLDVAMVDPTNNELFELIRVRTRCNVRPHIAGPAAIDRMLRLAYNVGGAPHSEAHTPAWNAVPGETVFDFGEGSNPKVSRLKPARLDDDPLLAASGWTGPVASSRPSSDPGKEVSSLRAEVAELRAMIERDERVLRKLLALLVERGVCTRDQLMAKIAD